jgi:hypothetical protein
VKAIRRGVTRVGVLILIGVTLVAGRAVLGAQPEYGDTLAPFLRSGGLDQRVEAANFAVRVLGIRGAAKLNRPDGAAIDTAGVWIIVKVRLETIQKTDHLGYLGLQDARGRIFLATERFSQPLTIRDLQPGLPTEGEVAFEVPSDDATGLSFQLSAHLDTDLTLNAVANIALPVTKEAVAGWLADSTPATLMDTAVVA